jgi:hypothetical protein
MSSKPQNVTQVQSIDPMLKPYVTQGLENASSLYNQATALDAQGNLIQPAYYPGQTYVGMSQPTEASMLALKNRATQGNILNPAAQQQQLGTIGGQYLAGNPFFSGAFKGAAEQAGNVYNANVNSALSNASQAGRYGSGAMNTALGAAGTTLANSLSNTAGQLAYQNYGAERGMQQQAAQNAPSLAQQDYFDINQLAQAGQGYEGYSQLALQDALNRYNATQNAPQNALAQYMGYVTGSPQGSQTTSQVYKNPMAGIAGGAGIGGSLGGTQGALIGAGLGGLAGLLG